MPNSRASSIVSQPPISSRPRSFSRLPRGKTSERVVPVAIAVIIACPPSTPRALAAQALLASTPATPRRRKSAPSQASPITHSATLSSWGAVNPASTS